MAEINWEDVEKLVKMSPGPGSVIKPGKTYKSTFLPIHLVTGDKNSLPAKYPPKAPTPAPNTPPTAVPKPGTTEPDRSESSSKWQTG